MRRGLCSLLAVGAVSVLCGLALEPTAALAAGRSRAQRPSARGTHHARSSSGIAPATPGEGYGSPHGSAPVRALQYLLARAGDRPGPIDGRYGPLTERAVRRFQAAQRLRVNGIAGVQTITHLQPQTTSIHPRPKTTPLPHKHASPHQRSHPRPALPKAQSQPPASAPAPRSVGHAHPSGSSSTGWLVLLGILGLGLLLIAAAWYRRHRAPAHHSHRVSPPPTTGIASTKAESSAPEARPVERPGLIGGVTPEAKTDQDSAEAPLRRAAQDGDAKAAFNLGLMREAQGDLAGAEAAYRRADQRGDAKAALNLGLMREARGDLAGAEAAYRRADQRGEPIGAFNLGVLLLESRGDLAGAEAAFRRADQRGDAIGGFNLGVLLGERGDLAGAEAAYRRADQRGLPAAASGLGVLLGERDDLAGAEQAYRRADQRGDAKGAFNLGLMLESRGDLAGAEAAYRRAEQRGDAEEVEIARAALLDLHQRRHTHSRGRTAVVTQ
jgi:TPR repeat protein